MKVGIVGAGFSGLVTAKVLSGLGHDVVVIEKCDDVGGVWSASRRYPGLHTQNGKDTYCFSDHPMPDDYPEWPSGEQVQRYLASYVEKFELQRFLRLGTELVSADPRDGGGWSLTTRPARVAQPASGAAAAPQEALEVDHLVVANGIFSDPHVPDYPGAEEFRAAGGRLLATSDVHDVEEVRGKHVVVVGYGKSACDVATALAPAAASLDVVARQLLWKVPRLLAGKLNYKYLLLTRLGEALFKYIDVKGVEKFLHGPGDGVRRQMIGSVQSLITKQLGLRKLGLVPSGPFEDIARSTVSLVTVGFFEAVKAGRITVHRDSQVVRLLADDDGRPAAELADGTVLPADLVLCGTGFRQHVRFLAPQVEARLHDDRGNFRLHRQIVPLDVPDLSFVGYNSSFFSPLSAEVAALYVADRLAGNDRVGDRAEALARVDRKLAWMEERTKGRHARGTNIIPFSMHNVDEVLEELELNLPAPKRAVQWLLPVDPGSYAGLHARLAQRLKRTGGARPSSSSSSPATPAASTLASADR
ncbi:Predicted flavoprotein CzcO associated with the cation diffusion facilitator CzcD [Quadrisphaera granulorum]|uniref:Cation diffusion facilitator CzcD-associated flavoprotein CzcO n=1 Tax=Quadrisphaera granulorum TaxID=317664 RepID=A0A316A999_9ACTN|nr:NAD(P)/FAD-dependent oxidoreductase [Quadrisphaera granulorum]PWJ53570.1 cation diffusion facilitator CzcD-associated flavoprotein CzcO [Quadrisphaera granulorum]SZE96912.1 Predicted flavoprotein CzcO associated with the cation diffusion facilitator CzcD [Quadrisphaera granulorum]